MASAFIACENEKAKTDYSGTYCLNFHNIEMTLIQTGNEVTFTVQSDLLVNGTGKIIGDTLFLKADASGINVFTSHLTFSEDGQLFSGPFQVKDSNGITAVEGILLGNKGACATYDIETNGIPEFIGKDFTQLFKIEMISRFRSGFGHSSTDGSEQCRSMKHYYNPYENYRENNTVEIYSPVTGTIVTVLDDYEGAGIGLKNKEIQIKPEDQPAFICDIYHCDLISSAIITGKKVQAGELLGYARMYYETWEEYVTSFDIALWVNTPSGLRLIPYFDAMKDEVFDTYIARGALSRQVFTITKEERDADPLECDGEEFLTSGHIDNWVTLH
jgi:hypothetical protein